jgi:dihydropteroate synthase
MGVVNVTPDSFFDGGVHLDAEDAVAAARRMAEEGAAIVDIGGESTRPGSEGVTVEEELRRVRPVLEELAGEVPVSIDTAKAEVARQALELGAEMVNDVTALRGDAAMAGVVADGRAYLCLMHMQGEPRTMQLEPRYDDVVSDVAAFLEDRLRAAVDAGVSEDRICLDPGIGFGKTVAQNFELVRRLDEIAALGRPVLVGFSHKSSLGRVLGDPEATTGPLSASLAAAVTAYERGATILRVHDVRETVEALTVAQAVSGTSAFWGAAGKGGKRAGRRTVHLSTDEPPARHPAASGVRRLRRPAPPAGRSRRPGRRGVSITVELQGLEVFGRHGVLEEEHRDGRTFLYDLSLDVSDSALSDRIEDAVDYRDVAACVREVSDGRRFHLLEALAAAVADALVERFPVERVRVRVRKPGIEAGGLPTAYSAATVERERRSG